MKINNISPGTAFGRVIKVNSVSNPGRKRVPVDKSSFEIAKVLNGGKSDKYSKLESENIREFFKGILGDYNGRDNIIMRKIGKDVFIASGREAAEYKNYIKLKTAEAKHFSDKQKEKFLSRAYLNADRRLFEKAENSLKHNRDDSFKFIVNGFHPNDRTTEELLGLEPIDVKFDKIIYDSIKARPGHQTKYKHLELEI